jgi:hypothetical protein
MFGFLQERGGVEIKTALGCFLRMASVLGFLMLFADSAFEEQPALQEQSSNKAAMTYTLRKVQDQWTLK